MSYKQKKTKKHFSKIPFSSHSKSSLSLFALLIVFVLFSGLDCKKTCAEKLNSMGGVDSEGCALTCSGQGQYDNPVKVDPTCGTPPQPEPPPPTPAPTAPNQTVAAVADVPVNGGQIQQRTYVREAADGYALGNCTLTQGNGAIVPDFDPTILNAAIAAGATNNTAITCNAVALNTDFTLHTSDVVIENSVCAETIPVKIRLSDYVAVDAAEARYALKPATFALTSMPAGAANTASVTMDEDTLTIGTPFVPGVYQITATQTSSLSAIVGTGVIKINLCNGKTPTKLYLTEDTTTTDFKNPKIFVNPDSALEYYSSTITAAPVGGVGPYTYSWLANNAVIDTVPATGPTINFTVADAHHTPAARITVIATDANGVKFMNSADYIMSVAPKFEITPVGDGTCTYVISDDMGQQFNVGAIDTTPGRTITISSASTGYSGAYVQSGIDTSWQAAPTANIKVIDGVTTVFPVCTNLERILSINRSGSGTVAVAPVGLAKAGDVADMRAFAPGMSVTLRPLAHEGYDFKGWFGNIAAGDEQDNPLQLTMNGSYYIGAQFVREDTQGGILTMTPSTTSTTGRTLNYLNVFDMRAAVPDLDYDGDVDNDDNELKQLYQTAFDPQSLNPGKDNPALNFGYEFDIVQDGKLDGKDQVVFDTCFKTPADITNPAPGYSCLAKVNTPLSIASYQVKLLNESGTVVSDITPGSVPSSVNIAAGISGPHMIESTVTDSAGNALTRRSSLIEIPFQVPLKLKVDPGQNVTGLTGFTAGKIQVTVLNGASVNGANCGADVGVDAWQCNYAPGTRVRLDYVPTGTYQLIGWSIRKAQTNIDLSNDPAELILDWTEKGQGYEIWASVVDS